MSLSGSRPDEKVIGQTTSIDTNFIETYPANIPASEADKEKNILPIKEIAVSSGDEDSCDLASDEFADIPELVRNIVSFEDDPTLPVITFRSVLLSVVFCVLGSFVSQLS